MTRIKVLGLALIAMFAITAISAGAASANPIWYTCGKAAKVGKTYTGHYAGKECKKSEFTETGGKYQLVPGIGKGKGLKTKGTTGVLHSVNPEAKVDIPVECTSFKGSGAIGLPNTVSKVTTTFSHCTALSAECKNGTKPGVITTNVLAGSLGWIEKTGKTVAGTDLLNEAAPGSGYIAEFTCSALGEIRSHGSVIGVNGGNTGNVTNKSTLTFAPGNYIGEQHAGCLKPEGETCPEGKYADNWTPIVNIPKLEGGPLDILMTEVKGAITGHPTEFFPPGGFPSGQESVTNQTGEKVGIYEEGSV